MYRSAVLTFTACLRPADVGLHLTTAIFHPLLGSAVKLLKVLTLLEGYIGLFPVLTGRIAAAVKLAGVVDGVNRLNLESEKLLYSFLDIFLGSVAKYSEDDGGTIVPEPSTLFQRLLRT